MEQNKSNKNLKSSNVNADFEKRATKPTKQTEVARLEEKQLTSD